MGNFFTRPNFEDRQLVQYSGTSITLSGETNIYPTGLLRIQKNPVPGYVATAAGWDGEVVWGPISGLTWNLSASCNSIINVTQLVACTDSGSTIQITSGGLTLDGGTVQFLDSLSAGTVNDYVLVIDGSGYVKSVPQSSITPIFTGGTGSCIVDLYVTNIHGCSPINIQPTSSDDVYMVMGGGNVMVGGTNPQTKFHISGSTMFNTDIIYQYENDGTTTAPTVVSGFKGNYISMDYGTVGAQAVGYAAINTSSSATSAVALYNNSSAFAQLFVAGSNQIKVNPGPVGSNFYRNKGILRTGPSGNTAGMVINPGSADPSATLWFEIDGAANMILKGDGASGSGNGFLGLKLNPDGTEMPTANLQIGGTGTTGSFKFIDGNQQSGYVLTSDSGGTATWQAPTGASVVPSPYIFGSPTLSIIPLSGNNTTLSEGSIILGGTGNTINDNSSPLSTIVNGFFNDIYDSDYSLINGGLINVISGQSYNVITNGRQNKIISRSTLTNLSGWKTITNGLQNTINIISGETGHETIINGRQNNILGTSTKYSTIINGDRNVISGSSSGNKLNIILNGETNSINEGNFNFITGQDNRLNESGFSAAFGGSNFINNSDYSFIFGFNNKILDASNGVENSRVILGSNSLISGQTSSVVILGDNITGNSSNTVYVPYLNIKNIGTGSIVFGLGLDANGNVVSGSTVDNDGSRNVYYVPSGETFNIPFGKQALVVGDLLVDGEITNSGQLVFVNGSIILSGGTYTDNGGDLINYEFEDGSGNSLLNIASLQGVNFTGINTGDTIVWNGTNFVPQVYSQATPFTGNTSASCITDLWVSNIYGCNNNLNITGDTYIAGTLYATSKSFAIPHPTEKDKQLIYGSLEGPENGVYHRGKLVGNNIINLPDYWSSLVDIETVTVTLTPNGSYQKLYVASILDNSVTVGSEDDVTINCFYTVYGERKDIKKLETEI
jgi:hypothetical protein